MYANAMWGGEWRPLAGLEAQLVAKQKFFTGWEREVQAQARGGWELHVGETWSSTAKAELWDELGAGIASLHEHRVGNEHKG